MQRPQSSKGYFWPVVWALCIHALLLAFLLVSFSSTPDLPPARPIVKATLYQLQSQNQATSQTAQKIAGEADKTRTANYDQEQLEQKKREQEREVAARRQVEEQRKVAARQEQEQKQRAAQQAAEEKKAAEQKRAEEKKLAEQKAAEQKKLELQKAEAARLKAAEEAKAKAEAERKKAEERKRQAAAEAERKKAEEQKKRAEEQARQKADAERKKREAEQAAKVAAEKAREAERRAQEERKAAALADLLGDGEPQFQRSQADSHGGQEAGRIDDLIVLLVSENWNRPESARRGMVVEVMVGFLPDGTISQVSLVRSSGNPAFDNSAIAAVRNVVRVREIQSLDRATYERLYRQRKMAFRPEDLGL